MSDKELWYNKYRPQSLDDYVWKDESTKAKITGWIQNPNDLPHLIMAGPYGTGKTTLALLLFHELKLDRADYLFINASLNTGIDTIRQDIIGFCENAGWTGIKIVVLDEAERLSQSAQKSLKGVMDTYGDHTRFIFTTNNLGSIAGALKSRARTVIMDAMDREEYIFRLVEIAQSEGVMPDVDAGLPIIETITNQTYPDLRKAIDIMQDSTVEGLLTEPSERSETEADWESFVVDTIVDLKNIVVLREMLAGVPANEIVDIYRFLYEKATAIFEDNEICGAAVELIAEHLDMHTRATFPDITVASLLIKLSRLYNV